MPETFRLGSFAGNHSVGMYASLSDEILLVPPSFGYKSLFQVDEVVETYMCNTELVGVFASANSNGVVIPSTTTEREQNRLFDAGIDVGVLDTTYTAIGNVILANDNGALVSRSLDDDAVETVRSALGVTVRKCTIADIPTVGSAGVATNEGVLLHRAAEEDDIDTVEKVLGVEAGTGTVNFGSPFVGSGMVANSYAVLAGESTTGPESARIQKALGFV